MKTALTYGELMNRIFEMTPEQRNQNVTVYVSVMDEFFPANSVRFADPNGVDALDPEHPYLQV